MFRRFAGIALFSLILAACGGKTDESNGQNSARQLGGGAVDPGSPPSRNDVAPTPQPNPGTGLPATCQQKAPTEIFAQFEDGAIDPRFDVTNLGPFSIDTNQPLFGKASLRLQATDERGSYLQYDTSGSCEVWIKLAVRADAAFVAGNGGTILRADAKSRAFALTAYGGEVRIAQEGHFGSGPMGAVGLSPGAVIGKLVADRTTILKLHVNLMTSEVSVGIDDAESSSEMFDSGVPLSEPASFTSVMFGSLPQFVLDPKGTLWLDEVSIK